MESTSFMVTGSEEVVLVVVALLSFLLAASLLLDRLSKAKQTVSV